MEFVLHIVLHTEKQKYNIRTLFKSRSRNVNYNENKSDTPTHFGLNVKLIY
jgi:hypothetical protein